jgi:hypothetical protein
VWCRASEVILKAQSHRDDGHKIDRAELSFFGDVGLLDKGFALHRERLRRTGHHLGHDLLAMALSVLLCVLLGQTLSAVVCQSASSVQVLISTR